MPRRSVEHMARGDEAVGLEPRDDAREGALAQVHGLGQLLHPALLRVARGEALEHLVLADAQAVLVERALERGGRPRVAVEQLAPDLDEAVFLGDGSTATRIIPIGCIFCVHN